ncbi:MAG: exosome complex RNA-binding protein Rrp4 [Candidatus Woesearchaeota archaeon]
MGKINVQDKDIVVPGEALAEGMDYLPSGGAFRDKENIYASRVGIVSINGRVIKLVPLNLRYMPRRGDRVIGQVSDVGPNAWYVEIGFYKEAAITLAEGSSEYIPKGADLTQYYAPGDYIIASVSSVSKNNSINLSLKGPGLRKLSEGRILTVNPAKVPRIIGKEASMISLIKNMTDCRVMVGQNGLIWVSGMDPEKERIAVEAIEIIDKRAHISGLTDEIKNFLEKGLGGKSGVLKKD